MSSFTSTSTDSVYSSYEHGKHEFLLQDRFHRSFTSVYLRPLVRHQGLYYNGVYPYEGKALGPVLLPTKPIYNGTSEGRGVLDMKHVLHQHPECGDALYTFHYQNMNNMVGFIHYCTCLSTIQLL